MRIHRPARLLSALLLAFAASTAANAQTTPEADAARVTALADDVVRAIVASFPEEAHGSGLTIERHDGLSDNSLAGVRAWQAREDAWAAELARIDGVGLRGRPEWVTFGMLRERVEASRAARVCRSELWPVNQMSGWQVGFSNIAALQPVGTPVLREQALARWRRMPAYLDNELANLREGVRLGYTTPRRNVQLVIEQLDALLGAPVEQGPFWSPAQRDAAPEFRAAWAALLKDQVMPAVARYRAYLVDEYLPVARTTVGVGALPNERACYQASFRSFTTLDRAPEETFALGQQRVARNQAEAVEIGRRAYGTADLDSIRARTTADGFASRDEMLAFANDAVNRARAAVPRGFRAMPRAGVVIEPHPPFLEATASDQYFPAAEDGSRPAEYRINLGKSTTSSRAQADGAAVGDLEYGSTKVRECESARVRECESARVRECESALVRWCGPREGSSAVHARNCHFEGAPRKTIPCDKPGARLRNLLSVCWCPVPPAGSRPCPAMDAAAGAERAAASALARAESRFLGPATCRARGERQCGRASE